MMMRRSHRTLTIALTVFVGLSVGAAGMAAAQSVEDLMQARGGGADASQDVNADLEDTQLAIALGKGAPGDKANAASPDEERIPALAVGADGVASQDWADQVNSLSEDAVAASAFGSTPPMYDTDRLFEPAVTSSLFLGMSPLSGEAALAGSSPLFGSR